mmetsp:Transcript_98459/g.177795  ORF Transcript_98459/g.177795 Transcript_98459/m.177795 type:complete len:305 (+) Transcript_98459:1078-1992(+)
MAVAVCLDEVRLDLLLRRLNHLPTVRSYCSGELQARQGAIHCPCKAIHGIGRELQRQLAAMQDLALRVLARLALGQRQLGRLPRPDEALQDGRQQALAHAGAHEAGGLLCRGGRRRRHRVRRAFWPQLAPRGQQRRVAEVVCHHDGRVEGCKVQHRDGLAVEARNRLQHGGALKARFLPCAWPLRGQNEAAPPGLLQQLSLDLHCLPALQEIPHGDARHSGHFDEVVQECQRIKDAQGGLSLPQDMLRKRPRPLQQELCQSCFAQLRQGSLTEVLGEAAQGVICQPMVLLHLLLQVEAQATGEA